MKIKLLDKLDKKNNAKLKISTQRMKHLQSHLPFLQWIFLNSSKMEYNRMKINSYH